MTERTYNKRLGWVWTEDVLDIPCPNCADPTCHTDKGWHTSNCKPVLVPDQWVEIPSMTIRELPKDLTDDDVTLHPLWPAHDKDLEELNGG